MAGCELIDIATHMLLGEMVEGSDISALQQSQEGFDPVGVGLIADILSDRMLDRFMNVLAHRVWVWYGKSKSLI